MRKLLIGLSVLSAAVVLSGQVQVPSPLPQAVSIATSSPFYAITSGGGAVDVAGTRAFQIDNTGVILTNGFTLRFSGSSGGAADLVFSRVTANEYGVSAVAFASLGTPANGTFAYCSDCTIANPCAGAGTGAFAKRLNGVWVCN